MGVTKVQGHQVVATALPALLAVCVIGLGSCCHQPMVNIDNRDSIHVEYRDRYHDRIIRDTTYVRDSVIVYHKGDTVIIYRDSYNYANRFVRDTVSVVDTVYEMVCRDRTVVEEQRHVPLVYRWSLYVALAALAWA